MSQSASPDESPYNPFAAPADPALTLGLDMSQPIEAVAVGPARKPGPGFWAALGWTVLLMFVMNAVAVFMAIVLVIAGVSQDRLMLALLPVTTTVTLVCALALSVAWMGRHTIQQLALHTPATWHVVLAVLAVAPLSIVIQEITAWAGEFLPTFNEEMYLEFAEGPWGFVLLFGCVAPGLGEEIFFRGFLGRGLVARMGLAWGTAWCAVLFAMIHIDPVQMVGVFVIGVVLQLTFLATRSLWIPILMHALNNALSFTLIKLNLLIELEHLPPPVVGSAALALVPLAVLLFRTRLRWILPDGEAWKPGYLTAEMPPRALGARAECRSAPLAWVAALGIGYAIFVSTGTQLF